MRPENSVFDCRPARQRYVSKRVETTKIFVSGIGPEKVEQMLVRIRTESPVQDDLEVRFEDLLTEVLKSLKIKKMIFSNSHGRLLKRWHMNRRFVRLR